MAAKFTYERDTPTSKWRETECRFIEPGEMNCATGDSWIEFMRSLGCYQRFTHTGEYLCIAPDKLSKVVYVNNVDISRLEKRPTYVHE